MSSEQESSGGDSDSHKSTGIFWRSFWRQQFIILVRSWQVYKFYLFFLLQKKNNLQR